MNFEQDEYVHWQKRVMLLISLLLLIFLIWASFTQIDEVARAEGRIIPSSKIQTVLSPEPGVVKNILVREGQTVKKDDILLELDDTITASSLGEAQAKASTLKAQIARLKIEHETDGVPDYKCPAEVESLDPKICLNETRLLKIRYENLNNKISVLKERAEQRNRELAEARANIERLSKSLSFTIQKRKLLANLNKKKLVSQTEFLEIQQQETDLTGQLTATKESLKRIESSEREANLQIKEARTYFRQEALRELTEKLSELSIIEETLKGADARVQNTNIRSPVAGIVNKLNITTVGGFLQAGSHLLDIVPLDDQLLIEAKIKPADIAFVRPGQNALIKITSYDFSIYGGLDGEVQHISADSVLDPDSKETFYIGLIKTPNAFLKYNQKTLPIMPGMICQVDILTGRKSILNYLLKPINKARREAFGER